MDYLLAGNTRLRLWGSEDYLRDRQSVELAATAAGAAPRTAVRLLIAPIDVKTDMLARVRGCSDIASGVGVTRWQIDTYAAA